MSDFLGVNHHRNEYHYSPGSLGARIERNKRELFDEIAALVQDDDIANRIEELVSPILSDIQELNFNLGLRVAEQLVRAEFEEKDAE